MPPANTFTHDGQSHADIGLQTVLSALAAGGIGVWEIRDTVPVSIVADAQYRLLHHIPHDNVCSLEELILSVHGTSRPAVLFAIQSVLSERVNAAYDIVYRIGGPENKWVRSTGKAFFDEQRTLISFTGISKEVAANDAAGDNSTVAQEHANALQEARDNFRTIVEQAPVAMSLLLGPEFVVAITNRRHLKYWGRTEYEALGRPIFDVLPEVKGQGFDVLLKNVYNTGEGYSAFGVPVVLRRNGRLETTYASFVYEAYRNADGVIAGVMVVVTEVTEQVMARKKLEESEARYRSVINAAPIAIGIFVGREMMIAQPNKAFNDIMGKGDTIEGKQLREAMPEWLSEEQSMLQTLDDVYTSGKKFAAAAKQIKIMYDGVLTSHYYDFSCTPLFDDKGVVYAILQIMTDVTWQTMAMESVEQAEASLRGAVELAELGTWHLDVGSGIFEYSLRLREWCGFTDHEIITIEKADSVIVGNDVKLVEDAMNEAISSGGEKPYNVEFTVVSKTGGRKRIIHAQGITFFNDEGIAVKVSGTAQDVTEQRQIQMALEQEVLLRTDELQQTNERLIHSNEELAQYAYVASHDLQEPLRKIRIFSGMLGNKGGMNESDTALVQKIVQSSDRMTMLINDLLEFSRLLRSDELMQPVDLSVIMAAVVTDFELMIREKNATVSIGPLPVVSAVSLQVNQLFYNLFSNAMKFTAPGKDPLISISAEEIQMQEVLQYILKPFLFSSYYRITITDNGIGFDTRYSEQIFEVFKRLHTKDVYPGSGVGLALCRRIVANHNGYLYVTSEPGKGSSFQIIFPAVQKET